ncbi:hypothetical protein H5410_032680 [Solanum commersonii]|uniref:Uncharacterized protein n=1 Tax=Solanum commersonii TaxID=4109 RepID=A0A9J5YQZ2_SOLCO|nr:hypothetical protein H5410_032680 [Solanum commersonii]
MIYIKRVNPSYCSTSSPYVMIDIRGGCDASFLSGFYTQMSQITFNSAPTRWERAVRLVYERFTRARHTHFREMDEESLRALSMITL